MGDVKILICDDSILARKQIKDILITCGYDNFIEATNGEQAVSLYREFKPQLVFLDIIMPEKDGIQAIREIRQFDSEAYIVIVSSVGTKSQLKAAIEEGARDFIQKPYSSNAITEVVKKCFEGR